jgi:hypothetical protein
MAGVQLIMLGMVGEYVRRVFLSLNKRPQYSIREQYDFTSEAEQEN